MSTWMIHVLSDVDSTLDDPGYWEMVVDDERL